MSHLVCLVTETYFWLYRVQGQSSISLQQGLLQDFFGAQPALSCPLIILFGNQEQCVENYEFPQGSTAKEKKNILKNLKTNPDPFVSQMVCEIWDGGYSFLNITFAPTLEDFLKKLPPYWPGPLKAFSLPLELMGPQNQETIFARLKVEDHIWHLGRHKRTPLLMRSFNTNKALETESDALLSQMVIEKGAKSPIKVSQEMDPEAWKKILPGLSQKKSLPLSLWKVPLKERRSLKVFEQLSQSMALLCLFGTGFSFYESRHLRQEASSLLTQIEILHEKMRTLQSSLTHATLQDLKGMETAAELYVSLGEETSHEI